MDTTRRQESGPGHEVIAAQTPGDASSLSFSAKEWCALLLLRRRYQQSHDEFSDAELAHLRFLRWLRQAGKLEPYTHVRNGATRTCTCEVGQRIEAVQRRRVDE
jgi:hypothetical protein